MMMMMPGQMISAGTAEGDGTVGIAIPLGPDGQPVVSMRTAAHATTSSSAADSSSSPSSGNAMIQGDSMVGGAAANGGGRRRPRAAQVGGGGGGGTKRRAIGNVVRSAVREGRNVKRQKIAELKRKGDAAAAQLSAAATTSVNDEHQSVPNPLPSISQILDPYMPPNLPGGAPLAAPGRVARRGRQQLVHTATHGTLPMAALEDAV